LNTSLKIAGKKSKQVGDFNSGVLAYEVNSLMTVVATTEICRGGLPHFYVLVRQIVEQCTCIYDDCLTAQNMDNLKLINISEAILNIK
jgi:hypothetical protein